MSWFPWLGLSLILATTGLAESASLFFTILEANKNVDEVHLFEGDIVQTLSKNALKDRSKRWPNGQVPYVISQTFSSYAKSQIQKAIDRYHEETCIRFVERTKEEDYINIVSKNGCYSHVGVEGGAQELSLAKDCYPEVGIIMHEMMHALGFYHEQSRTDRDNYVTIYWNNIEDGEEDNFRSYTTSYIDDLGMNYDYSSIMHYSQYAFSKNGYATIVPKQSGAIIGNRANFSAIDIQKINKYYECSGGGGGEEGAGGGKGGGGSCFDIYTSCSLWASKGYCSTSSKYYQTMKDDCPASCGFCCKDSRSSCSSWASKGYCSSSQHYQFMKDNCPASCGICSCADPDTIFYYWAQSGYCSFSSISTSL